MNMTFLYFRNARYVKMYPLQKGEIKSRKLIIQTV